MAGLSCQQTANLGWCEVHEAGRVLSFTPLFPFPGGRGGQERVGEHGESDVSVPAHVAADLVLVQAAFVLRALETFLDFPAAAGDAYEVGDGGIQRGAGEVVGDLVGLGDAAAGEHPPLPGGGFVAVERIGSGQAGGGPVVVPLALRAASGGQPLPGFGRGLADEVVDARVVDLLGFGDGDNVGELDVFQETAEAGVLAVGGVRGDPGDGQGRGERPPDDGAGQLAFGGEGAFVGDAGSPAALAVIGPGCGQVQLAVDQGVAPGGGVGGETAIWQFSVRPAVPEYWRWTPAEVVPFFTKPLSSMISTPPGAPRCSAMYVCRSSRISSASQRLPASRCCSPSGVAWPAYSASCQPFLRPTGPSSPRT